ncbi:sporulation histidine kinase inhibitor Sda [Halobacillus yeomjeoni]|uniref:Sporulation histidine kinase inhibitor Sda n=1 Tax=Halobacillus yeomjeoni TaxID=311194 RepID=A0A931MU88_9BACI|nr:sporulation histidine kinase inhibitor Sda [Halobacillus yeomjeoni]MBH0229678.1 sporulation histidine kinase inhibitor Sda [Halobacillus yeomjeoni]
MKALTNSLLVKTYVKAKQMNLSPDFIGLVTSEMEERKLSNTTTHSDKGSNIKYTKKSR